MSTAVELIELPDLTATPRCEYEPSKHDSYAPCSIEAVAVLRYRGPGHRPSPLVCQAVVDVVERILSSPEIEHRARCSCGLWPSQCWQVMML